MSINLTHTNDSILPDSGNLNVTGNLVVSSRLGVGTSTLNSVLNVGGNIAVLSSNKLFFPDSLGQTSFSGTQLNIGFNSFLVTGNVSYANVISDRQIVITKSGHASDPGQKIALLIRPSADVSSVTYSPFEIQRNDTSTLFTVSKQGNVGIGVTDPTSNLHVVGTANVTGNVSLSNTVTIISTTGNVGIGTTSPSYKLQVSGSFAATTKSFVIDHPTKENHTLVYGSLEGPENGVYVRGRLQNHDVIDLPDYWNELVDRNSITVQLTPIGKHQNLYVKEIANNSVTVAVTGLFRKTIDCFYVVHGERKDVPKLQVEVRK